MEPGEFGAVAVIDVLRATTTIVTALENGARGVVPVGSPDDARAWRAAGPDVVLGGERGARALAGFDLGNSPLEYGPERVAGKLVVMTTTNGTAAFERARSVAGGAAVIAACLRNAQAAAQRLRQLAGAQGGGALIVCAGTDGRFSAEDAYAAAVVLEAMAREGPLELGDGAQAALRMAGTVASPRAALRATRHGRKLVQLGFETDVDFCAKVSVSDTVPTLVSGVLVREGSGPARGE
ncbi:MAG: 2-phosphosulfolactate phosphatase [Firmicutes bacterium]|nr:2-phosphosulfolactate phosphatase [Bacillota bacterium]